MLLTLHCTNSLGWGLLQNVRAALLPIPFPVLCIRVVFVSLSICNFFLNSKVLTLVYKIGDQVKI